MGKAIVYVAVTGGAALVSFLWYVLDRPPAMAPAAASLLAMGIAAPIVLRKDFQFVGIPGVFELFFGLATLCVTVYAGLKRSEHLFWLAVVVQTIPSIRISLVSLKAYQRPKSLKITVGLVLAALFGLNVYLGVKHSHWLGETSVTLVKEWFPEATAPTVRTPEGQPTVKPKVPVPPPPPPPVIDPAGPIAVIAGRELTKEMVEYQRFIDSLIDEKTDRNDAIAALLQAYTSRAILEKKFKAFDPEMLKDERQWLMNRTKDTKLVHRIRTHKSDELFLDVYVGANGLYKRKLQEIFGRYKDEELKKRCAEVLRDVQAADGVERPGPKLDGVTKEECRYSFRKGEFIPKFDIEAEEQPKPRAGDTLAPKLAKMEVNSVLKEILWGDMNGMIVRRIPDDYKGRPLYEAYRVVEDGLYSSWFKKQCADMAIEIQDPDLRAAMIVLAKDVTHIIKRK
jgi:hypothetical protein